MSLNFTVCKKDSASGARLGRLETAHGLIETPAFMPVGTQGSVKGISPRDLIEMGYRMILSNTYHLYLRPGVEVIRDLGGLHKFMGWEGSILTDSGGFQVLSMGALREINEEGVRFQSHLDGSTHFLTPEKVIEIQEALGSDLAMVLDECIPYPASRDYARTSTHRTVRWAHRSLESCRSGKQAVLAIVQGGVYKDLREQCVKDLVGFSFDGFAVGGLGVGEDESQICEMAEFVANILPEDRPRYLMGVGRPQDLIFAARCGYDLFDCVIPTRNARNGTLFTSKGKISIKRTEFSRDHRPVDELCGCYCCRHFSRAYLRHLYMAGEILAAYLHSLHNLTFYHGLMEKIREAIREGRTELWPSDSEFVTQDSESE